jgi:hypothetical protein
MADQNVILPAIPGDPDLDAGHIASTHQVWSHAATIRRRTSKCQGDPPSIVHRLWPIVRPQVSSTLHSTFASSSLHPPLGYAQGGP